MELGLTPYTEEGFTPLSLHYDYTDWMNIILGERLYVTSINT